MNYQNRVRGSYDKTATDYAKNNQMQSRNLSLIVEKALKLGANFREDLLELGCGTGNFLEYLQDNQYALPKNYRGFDLSAGMLEQAQSRFPGHHYQVGDICQLIHEVDEDSQNVIFSNATLHWLNSEALTSQLIRDCKTKLKNGGHLVFSMAGEGIIEGFLQIRETVIQSHSNQPYFNPADHLRTPFLRPSLSHAIHWLLQAELLPLSASIDMRPVPYVEPTNYLTAIRAYGEDIYTAAIAPQMREKVWNEIETMFLKTYQNRDDYRYQQGILSIIAQKQVQ